MQAPGDMLSISALLGDLFPSEWPPPGAARRGTAAHPPPTHMHYRACLARSFEPVATPFRRLVGAAATAQPRLLRAQLTRLSARASGLCSIPHSSASIARD